MSQVTILPIDMAQNTESQSVSNYSDGSESSGKTDFSQEMAKHQQQESGNKSQRGGKSSKQSETTTENHSNNNAVTDKSSKSNNAVKESESPVKDPTSTEENTKETTNTQAADNNEDNTAESPVSNKENAEQGSEEDIAQQLLSFILASDSVSAKHNESAKVNKFTSNEIQTVINKPIEPVKESVAKTIVVDGKVIQLNPNAEKSENKIIKSNQQVQNEDAELLKNNKQSIPMDESKAFDKITKKESLGEQSKQSIKASFSDIKNSDLKSNNANNGENPIKDVSPNSKTNDIKAVVEGEDNFAEKKAEKTVQDKVEHQTTATPVTKPLKEELESLSGDAEVTDESTTTKTVAVSDKTSSDIIKDDKVVKDNIQPVKTTAENSAVVNQATQVSDVKATNSVVEENKNTTVEQSVGRVVNQATNPNGASSQQQNSEQSSQQNQKVVINENEKNKETEQISINKDQVDVVDEKITEKTIERKASQTNHNETVASKTLSQQSLNYAEEQAVQSQIAKASADSISVQSAKTAINIQNETIAIYRKDFSNAVKEKVLVMMNQKVKQLEIRLDPPELGSMQVKLNLQNEQAAVNFVVQNQQAKEALEQNMGKLRDMLAQSGVDVGDANIEQRSQKDDQGDFADQKMSDSGGIESDSTDEEMAMLGANLYKASATGVDYYA